MNYTYRHKTLSLLFAAVVTLLTAPFWSRNAAAITGGGVTPIGTPWLSLVIAPPVSGPFEPSCGLLDTSSNPDSKGAYGGSLSLSKTWPTSLPNSIFHDDSVDTYADDTGTFWATATSRSLNQGESATQQGRTHVEGSVFWAQRFIKNSSTAYFHFTVSKAQLLIDQALYGFNNGGACARIRAEVSVNNESDGSHTEAFFEEARLASGANNFLEFKPDGPMTYTVTDVGIFKKVVDFDKYNGTVDLSGIDVGQVFTVEFFTYAMAGTGFSEFAGEAIASYRDPISFGGGVSVEVDGVTPLDNALSTPIPRDQSHAEVIQPDGKIVSVGSAFNGINDDFALARYNANGSADMSFDGDGKLTTDFKAGADAARGVALQSDNKILVVGAAYNGADNDIAVARYNADGSLDTGFATGGKLQLDLAGADDAAQSIVVQADGKILVAGYTGNGAERDFVILRLNADGTLDTTGFGAGGWTSLDFAGGADAANAVVVQADSKIVLAGTADLGAAATQTDVALARYNSNGTLDDTFGTAGKQTTDFGNSPDFAEALTIQASDGKLLVAGHTSVAANADFALARYNTDGSPDTNFGTNGKVVQDISGNHDYAYALAMQNDGKILVAGYTAGPNRDFVILRLTATGSLDTQFGVGGKTQIDFGGGDDLADSMSVQADGNIIVAGWAATATGDDFAMARLNP